MLSLIRPSSRSGQAKTMLLEISISSVDGVSNYDVLRLAESTRDPQKHRILLAPVAKPRLLSRGCWNRILQVSCRPQAADALSNLRYLDFPSLLSVLPHPTCRAN